MSTRAEQVFGKMTTDIAVIGSGPGGAVAATLFAEAGYCVLMIEEGPDLSIDSAPHFSRDEILQKYRSAGVTVAFGATKIAYVEGCCIGGGSEINRGIYHRTPDYILEKWQSDFAVRDLAPQGMIAHFEACEATAAVEYLPCAAPGFSSRLQDGAVSLGWRAIEAPRLFRYDAAGGGCRQSMSETFVPRFLRAGGRLIANTRVDLLRRSSGKWLLMARNTPDSGMSVPVEIHAERVFVACGAVQTPALLRCSGFTRNIGNTLQFHPMLKVVAEFPDAVNQATDVDPVHQIKEFEPEIGIGCSISNRPMLNLAMMNHPAHLAHARDNWRRMGIYYVQTSGGRSSVRNLPLFRDPLVRMANGIEDMRRLAKGLKLLAEALLAAGAVAVYPSLPGYPVLRSAEDVRKLPDDLKGADGSVTSVHVFSSCPMGENPAKCATDSFGEVHGAENLYISDASILCTPTGVNPQGTVMAISHRNAMHAIDTRFR